MLVTGRTTLEMIPGVKLKFKNVIQMFVWVLVPLTLTMYVMYVIDTLYRSLMIEKIF